MDNQVELSPIAASRLPGIISNSTRLIATRWVAGVTVLVATAFGARVANLPLPEAPLYLVGAIILVYNAALVWLTRRAYTPDDALHRERIRRLVVLQVVLDWLSMAAFLHLTGGVTSPAMAFFFLHVVMVTILLPGRSPVVFAAAAVGVVVLITILEGGGALPHYTVIPGLPADLHSNSLYALAQTLFFAVALFATVFLTASIMERLRERERQVAVLLQTSRDVSSTLNLTDVLNRLARSAAQALSAPAASIRLLDESGDRLNVVAAYGLSQAYLDKGPVEPTNPLAREVLAGHAVIVKEATTDSRIQYPQKVIEEGIHSMLVVPIAARRPLGILRVYAREPDHFTPEDADYVMAIARQGATALENALAHDALQRADQERAQFVRMVTHELRAPVTGAQSLLRVLLRDLVGELTAQQRDIIGRLENRLEALLALINDLLALAATKSVGKEQALTPVPVQPLVRRVVERLASQAEEKGLAFTFEAPADGYTIYATEEGLLRIFDNLIGNAVKYTPQGGTVAVRIQVHEINRPSSVVITVADTGIGIPEDAIEKLGEEFFRAPNARQSGITGTGLGLAIAKQLIAHFGGLMSVHSALGEGTTFTVTFPLIGPKN